MLVKYLYDIRYTGIGEKMTKKFSNEIIGSVNEKGEPIVKIKITSNFGKYQKTHNKIRRIERLTKIDFNVKEPYRTLLIRELKKSYEHLVALQSMLEAGVEQ